MPRDRSPIELIVAGSVTLTIVLLVAPWTPPQVAVLGGVGIFLLAVTLYVGGQLIWSIVYAELDARLPEEPPEYPDVPVDDATMEQYMNDELDDDELEAKIEEALE